MQRNDNNNTYSHWIKRARSNWKLRRVNIAEKSDNTEDSRPGD